ncbi:hypothetical protein [Paenarthrobacter sp. PH39-S1]|uniref:hypothetical protein n=1 Tax=Paenarthrobacter sp. PH39-S1 TaxID=3046204 RepID=UPI0024BB36B1|nr:hypothetical protein [Paenarthrobacter sp. PH39-S1]MDJ0355441.1 hypothetical protein [Paenarthrobacter sp. PH39-S1]
MRAEGRSTGVAGPPRPRSAVRPGLPDQAGTLMASTLCHSSSSLSAMVSGGNTGVIDDGGAAAEMPRFSFSAVAHLE